ncbi:MAG: FAD/NAD(P)-binding protein [Pirellulaceae bacterium]
MMEHTDMASGIVAPTVDRTNPWATHAARIVSIRPEVPGIATYELAFDDPAVAERFRFLPGQFNMLYLPGIGESAISISSDPERPDQLLHTIRVVGNVTKALARKRPGDQVLVRGPFGSAWPVAACEGSDLVIATGGVGLAPLRPVIHHVINHRDRYGHVWLLYGSRTPKDLLYADQYEAWRDADIDVRVTVDLGDEEWTGQIGVVPMLFYHLRLDAPKTRVLTCGPEVMMRFVIFECLARKLRPSQIHLSMERNMNCAVGFCGHCQLGPTFVCKDGPVFSYEKMEPYLDVEDF